MNEPRNSLESKHIIFFDGICNFCNFWVQFLMNRDKKRLFQFAPLQGEHAKRLLSHIEDQPDSIVYWKKGEISYKSKAALAILADLGGVWSLFLVIKIFPQFFLDKIYDLIAKNRYAWFGQQPTCRVPTEEERSHFLD